MHSSVHTLLRLCVPFLLGTLLLQLEPASGDVLCTGLPNGGRLYCPVACCISQEGRRQSYYCCGSTGVYRDPDTRPSRVSYSSVRIDWWNSLLISLAISILLSVILSLICCFVCSRRRR